MVAQTAEWVCEQDKVAQTRSMAEDATGQTAVDADVQHSKLAPARGIVLGLLMGALCWAVIISAYLQLR